MKMIWIRWLPLLWILDSSLVTAGPARADGPIIPELRAGREPLPERKTRLTIRHHRVGVSIDAQVAITRVEQESLSEHEWEAEGIHVFSVRERASISGFAMWIDGEPVEG